MAQRELKMCLPGDTGVGKSSIVWRFVEDSFDPNINPTIGASFMTKTVQYELHKFLIWDTAGQERTGLIRSPRPFFPAPAAFPSIHCDASNQVELEYGVELEHLVQKYRESLKEHYEQHVHYDVLNCSSV
ncbi:ras-related protein Rab-31-like isoform 4-T4 [Salvelinus alpinus]